MGNVDDSPVRGEAPAAVGSLRKETARVRDLLQVCREDGVDVAPFQEGIRTTRELVAQRQLDDAFSQLLQLKMRMLDQILLRAAPPLLPPGEIENPPVAVPPPENVRSSLPRGLAWKVKVPRR
jgi:hypothetical protein